MTEAELDAWVESFPIKECKPKLPILDNNARWRLVSTRIEVCLPSGL